MYDSVRDLPCRVQFLLIKRPTVYNSVNGRHSRVRFLLSGSPAVCNYRFILYMVGCLADNNRTRHRAASFFPATSRTVIASPTTRCPVALPSSRRYGPQRSEEPVFADAWVRIPRAILYLQPGKCLTHGFFRFLHNERRLWSRIRAQIGATAPYHAITYKDNNVVALFVWDFGYGQTL